MLAGQSLPNTPYSTRHREEKEGVPDIPEGHIRAAGGGRKETLTEEAKMELKQALLAARLPGEHGSE